MNGAEGAWKVMVDCTNRMGHNLTEHVRDVINCAEAAGRGEPGRRVTCDKVRGEFRELKQAVNAMAGRWGSVRPRRYDAGCRIARNLGPGGPAAKPRAAEQVSATRSSRVRRAGSAGGRFHRRLDGAGDGQHHVEPAAVDHVGHRAAQSRQHHHPPASPARAGPPAAW